MTSQLFGIFTLYLFGCVGAFGVFDETPQPTVKYPRLFTLGMAMIWPAVIVLIGALFSAVVVMFATAECWAWMTKRGPVSMIEEAVKQ